jgi:hypothetical protein
MTATFPNLRELKYLAPFDRAALVSECLAAGRAFVSEYLTAFRAAGQPKPVPHRGRKSIWSSEIGQQLDADVTAMSAERKRGITDAVVNVIKRYPERWGRFKNSPDSLEARFYQVRRRLKKDSGSVHD